jgi:hypothetical protein
MKFDKSEFGDCYSEIIKYGEFDFNFLIRNGGSITLYGTRPMWAVHAVAFDTLDNAAPSDFAKEIIALIVEEANKAEKFVQAVRLLEEKIKEIESK